MGVWSSNAEGPKAARIWPSALQPNSSCFVEESVSVGSSFPKSVRLRKRADFLRLSDSSDKFAVKGFLIVWLANGLGYPRLGVTVSKKIGCAATRNRVKRCIRELFRHNRMLLSAVDMNVIARRESSTMDFRNISRELEKAFRHIGKSPCSRASRSL
jgi:ribonuclease P protein component